MADPEFEYKNPTPVAVALVRVDGGLLAGRRAIEPRTGQMAFPGGYVNELESAEAAAARELFEETGVEIPVSEWRPVATRVTPDNRLLIFVLAARTLAASDLRGFVETAECDALTIVTVLDVLAFPLHTEILQHPALWAE